MDALVQRLRAALTGNAQHWTLNQQAADAIEQLQQANAALAKDAARYRFLRRFIVRADYLDGDWTNTTALTGDHEGLDAAIDQAISTEQPQLTGLTPTANGEGVATPRTPNVKEKT